MKISVIIPNWNGRQLLEKHLPSVIKASENPDNNIHEIIIVDDGSEDSSVRFIKRRFGEKVVIFRHKKNRGFSAACNTGARMAKGDVLCLLNTDVSPQVDFLANAPKLFSDKKVFAVGLHQLGYGPATASFRKGLFSHNSVKESSEVLPSMWASGGSALFRRKIWWELKGFDEILFSPFYWEDVDLSYRAWKRGYKILWDPHAIVHHKHESVINKKNFSKNYTDRIKERNELLFIWKNITSQSLFKRHINYLFERTWSHPGYIRIILYALSRYKQVKKARKVEKRESKVSDESVFAIFNK